MANYNINIKDLARYQTGDTYTVASRTAGYITSGSKEIDFTIFLDKKCSSISNVEIAYCNLRTVTKRINLAPTDIESIAYAITENQVLIRIVPINALDEITNTVVGMDVGGTITFG